MPDTSLPPSDPQPRKAGPPPTHPPPLQRLEGSLLGAPVTAPRARDLAQRWVALGLGRLVAPPNLLRAVAEIDRGSTVLVGVVGHPTGCHTLATKCMEALECIRLGAESVEVALDPSAFLAADAAAVEKEMATLLKTVPEVEVGFTLPWPPPEAHLEDLLLRILRAVHPPFLMVEGVGGGSRPGASSLRSLRERLHRKVRLGCSLPQAGVDEVAMALEAGCAFVRTDRPEVFAGGAP